MRDLAKVMLLFLVATGGAQQKTAKTKAKMPVVKTAPDVPLNGRERAVQVLNRFTYGVRPGDVETVQGLGVDAWFAQQLNPAAIPDQALDKRLGEYPTLRMQPGQALDVFPDRGAIQLVADGRRPYPTDAVTAGVYEVEVSKLLAEREDKAHPHAELSDAEKAAAKKVDQVTAARVAGVLFALPRGQRMAALNGMPVEDRIAFANNVSGDQRNTLMAEFAPREREAVLAMQGGVGVQYRAYDELAQAHVLREVLSERQVQEVMTDFWFNHFNVFFNKDSDQWYTTSYERDVIRPHALGKFRDLLLATAMSPAMMIYLDNWLSVGPDSLANGVNPKNPNAKKGNKGLNENYGREVMELHTLGVGGGYSQADVTSLAAILTGWGADRPNMGGGFVFDATKHEPGAKEWFGYSLSEAGDVVGAGLGKAALAAPVSAGNGMRQGVTALALLAAAPQTAHFISYLIAQRFVADEPPAALVERMAKSYLDSDGDIKVVLTTLVDSPEFGSRKYFRNKVKTPAEFLASAFRATATDPANPGAMVTKLRELGEEPYRALPPTGYIVTADHWMNTGALVARLNFAYQLTQGKFANQKFDASRVLAFGLMADRTAAPKAVPVSAAVGPDTALRVLEGTLIGGAISRKTDQFIHGQMAEQPVSNPTETLDLLTALLLGSPEFQVR